VCLSVFECKFFIVLYCIVLYSGVTCRRGQEYKKKWNTKSNGKCPPYADLLPVVSHQPNFACGVVSWMSFLVLSFVKIGWKVWEQWGVEILAFPLTWHIAYTTACCYRTSRDKRTGRYANSCPLDFCLRPPFSVLASTWFKFLTCIMARCNYLYWWAAVTFFFILTRPTLRMSVFMHSLLFRICAKVQEGCGENLNGRLMGGCVENITTKNYSNLIIGFKLKSIT